MRRINIFLLILVIIAFALNIYIPTSFAKTETINENNSKNASTLGIQYKTHIQGIGWQPYTQNGKTAGTTDQSLRLEGINIQLLNSDENLNITYQAHIQDIGWQEWKENGEIAGTEGKLLRLEAIKICLENTDNYSVMYRVHIQDIGWQNWKIDGEIAGTEGKSLRVEAIEIKIVEKGPHVSYRSHIQDIGWQEYVVDGEQSGTEGKSLRLEALNIELINAPTNAKIIYKAHIQDIGWQNWMSDGKMAGTEAAELRMEAIQIKLENLDDYTVEYRVHIQDIGWSGWYIDGETAGTTNQSMRLEAIQIRIVPHYKRYYTGIDVSRWQGEIDYNKLVATGQIDFMIPRIGWYSENQSKFIVDVQFERNYKETTSRKIPIGAYIYSYATSVESAKKEAQETINYLKSTGQTKFDLPIFFDIEDDTQISLGKEKITQIAIAFCEEIKSAGFETGVYSYSYWLTNYMDLSKLPEDYSIWVANFGNNTGELPSDIYKYSNGYDIWQYTDKAQISGIEGYVDMNICYRKYF